MISDVELQSTPFSPEAGTALLEAARALSSALEAHAVAVVAAGDDTEALVAADETLAEVLREADDAYTRLTGEVHPMRVEAMYGPEGCGCEGGTCGDDSEAGHDHAAHGHGSPSAAEQDAQDAEDATEGLVVTILQRHDYVMGPEAPLLAAGRTAYLANNPGSTEAEATAAVSDAGDALQELGNAEGWGDLWKSETLDPIGGVVAVLPQPAPLDGDPEEWADLALDEFVEDGVDPLYVQVDVYSE